MNKIFRCFVVALCISMGSVKIFAQPVSDPTTLDKFSQINNASVQVVDLLKQRANTPRMMELIPKLSPFAIYHLDSVDVIESHKDTIFMNVYTQNEEYKGSNGFCVVYVNGKLKTIMISPQVVDNDPNWAKETDRTRFEYTITSKSLKMNVPVDERERNAIRYILHKQYVKTPKPKEPSSIVEKDVPFMLKNK
ncbi:MAG: hypothetical protein PHI48_12355 [Bacteroidales bacterium]|nr:hypothetical protein [Bacteroidales bacterium]